MPEVVHTRATAHANAHGQAWRAGRAASSCEALRPSTDTSAVRHAEAMPGVTVMERDVTLREVRTAALEGTLLEAFGTGTACGVQPVTSFKRGGDCPEELRTQRGPDHPESLAVEIKDRLEDLQTGRVASPWSVPFD